MNDSLELISLAELIEQVKADLLAGAGGGPGANPVFFVDGVEVTAQVVVRRERNEGGKAGLGLSIVGFKADAGIDTKTQIGNQLTQTVTIKLSPLLTKDAYLARLPQDQRAKLEDSVARAVTRGGRDASGQDV